MIYKIRVMVLLTGIFLCTIPHSAHADWKDFLNGLKEELTDEAGLSERDIARGLKQALEVGTKNVVKITSKKNGYFKNPRIKIPIPKKMRKVEKYMRNFGFGKKMDEFERSMNRAAERAAPKAKKIFWDAIKEMKIRDARKILKGRKNEATLYFKEKTYSPLEDIFNPIVHKAMTQVGVTRIYKDINTTIKTIPFLDAYSFDLDEYVTQRALDGLFIMVAEEERKIRKDPKARVTKLLRKVFGNR